MKGGRRLRADELAFGDHASEHVYNETSVPFVQVRKDVVVSPLRCKYCVCCISLNKGLHQCVFRCTNSEDLSFKEHPAMLVFVFALLPFCAAAVHCPYWILRFDYSHSGSIMLVISYQARDDNAV